MASTVFLHVLAHTFVEQLTVLCQVHVDKVYDNDTTHIAETQLACQLVGCTEVGLQGVGFLSVFFLDTCTTVDVDHVHSLCVFNNEVCAALVVNGTSKTRLNLLGYVEIVENGHIAFVQLDNACFFWGNQRDVIMDLVVDLRIVNMDAVIGGVEQIAQQCNGSCLLFKDQLWTFCRLLYLGDGVFPSFQEYFQFLVEFSSFLSFCNGSYDDAKILGLHALYQLLQSATLFSTFNFTRYRNLISKRYQYHVAPGKT